jgi:hypothetical protein
MSDPYLDACRRIVKNWRAATGHGFEARVDMFERLVRADERRIVLHEVIEQAKTPMSGKEI